ncbi:hypothetical protein [Vibrio phage VCPH]|nr:hypothetical protein [Vibrio phage VCPH]
MVGTVKNYLIIGLLAALAGVGFMWKDAQHTATELESKLKQEQMYSSGLVQEIGEANYTLSRQREVAVTLNNKIDTLEASLTSKIKEINQYKGRQHVVYAKPGLVERMEQKALDKFFDGVADED